ncbi:MAG: alkaline phosphatase family protein [Bacteroidota bacterium]|nr:alkaline phosphatase family protein [Bacteroidota bacterium]
MIKNKVITLMLILGISVSAFAQRKTENIIIVTLDGMRWQEVFGGADSVLLRNKKYTKDSVGTNKKFWSTDLSERRKKLFPFLWSVVMKNGQLHGNRNEGSFVNVANPYSFSYPGYNEIFTGYPDTAVNSNDKIKNKNINVLEFLNQQNGFEGKVAAFSTWDAFPYILNKWRSGVYVNSDVDSLKFSDKSLSLINDLQFLAAKPIDVRLDVLTYMAAREYMKAYQPRVLYIAFDETDDFAHGGEYDQYLKSAHAEDAMIADLWNYIQSSPKYKDKTTLLITCDHGRGDLVKDNWRHHGQKIPEASQIWVAAMGPDTEALGEIKSSEQLYQKQFAATIARLLGFNFTANHPVADPVIGLMKNKTKNKMNYGSTVSGF